MLLVVGGRDKPGTAASQQLAALLHDSEVAVIEGAGAVLNTEAQRELARLAADLPRGAVAAGVGRGATRARRLWAGDPCTITSRGRGSTTPSVWP